VFRQIWQRIVTIEALKKQTLHFAQNCTFLKELEPCFLACPEFSQSRFVSNSKIAKFIKTNDNAWRCEIITEGLDFTISALIKLDEAYPEIPPIFALDKVATQKTTADEEMKEEATEIESLLR
jgi:hypothetical protein